MKKHLLLVLLFTGLMVRANGQQVMSFEQVISTTLENNFAIRIERNTAQQIANQNNTGAIGYLPTVGITADQNWSSNNTRQEFFSGQVNEKNDARNQSTTAAIRLDWTFFDGFAMFARDKRLQLQEDAASLNLTAQMEMQVYQAAVLFYTLAQHRKLHAVYVQAMELSRYRYEQTELKVRNGAASELQLIQARMDMTSDSATLLSHLKTMQEVKINLGTVMGFTAETAFEIDGITPEIPEIMWEQAAESAAAQNTTLLLAKADIAILTQQRKEAVANYYPQVSFYSQYAFTTSQNQVGILNSNRSFGPGVGFSLRWNILDRLANYTTIRNIDLQQNTAELRTMQHQQLIDSELQQCFNEYRYASQLVALESTGIADAGALFDIARQAYDSGSMTALELREIQFTAVQAINRQLTAELALQTAALNVSLTTGDFKRLLQ